MAATIDEYLDALAPDKRAALQRLREQIHAVVPGALEGISYGRPAFRLNGSGGGYFVGFGATKPACSLYPGAAPTRALAGELLDYRVWKGTVNFQPSRPLAAELMRKLIEIRLAERARASGPPWLHFADAAFGHEFDYPSAGPNGEPVRVDRTMIHGHETAPDEQRVHLSTDDARTVYFELQRVPKRSALEALNRLRVDVGGRFDDARFDESRRSLLAGEPAVSLRLTFADSVRMAIVSQREAPSDRVILDPRSATNYLILADLVAGKR